MGIDIEQEHQIADMKKFLTKPEQRAELDEGFIPTYDALCTFKRAVQETPERTGIVLGFERENGLVRRIPFDIFSPNHPDYPANFPLVEILTQGGVWGYGAGILHVGVPREARDIGHHLEHVYSTGGARNFDAAMMGGPIYRREKGFAVEVKDPDDVPPESNIAEPVGGYRNGKRIGVDYGGTDEKLAVVVDGNVLMTAENNANYFPKEIDDPEYHFRVFREIILQGMRYLDKHNYGKPDAVGVSAAGIYVDNELRLASLFKKAQDYARAINDAERAGRARNTFLRIQQELGVPMVVANDGAVAALAISMDERSPQVLAGALGTSTALGGTNPHGNLTTELYEGAFMPIDCRAEDSPIDPWSGANCAERYLSQSGVIRLARNAGISENEMSSSLNPGDQLKLVQTMAEERDPRAQKVFEGVGVYLGYAIPYYLLHWPGAKVVSFLGRVMSGRGGEIAYKKQMEVLERIVPDIYTAAIFPSPGTEKARLGQAVAAASLPYIR